MQPSIQKIQTPAGKFYVYTLARPDGSVFYVGKGKNGRINDHEKEAARRCGCPKCQIVRSIWDLGGSVVKSIVFVTEIEQEALDREREMILTDRANLCNRTHGCSGRSQPYRNEPRPERDAWELYRKLHQECLIEIRQIERHRQKTIGPERLALRDEVKQKRKLLAEWHEQTKRSRSDIRAFFKGKGATDPIQRQPKKPW